MNKAYKYARGTVWWIRDSYCQESWPGVQSGQRPVVILSANERGTSTVVEVCTLTTTDKRHVCPAINIPVNIEGRVSYIQCNQHKTLPLSAFSDYYATLTAETMTAVEIGLLTAQGMTHYIDNDAKITYELYLHLDSETENEHSEDDCKTESATVHTTSSEVRKSNKWTTDRIKQFLKDHETMSTDALMVKYKFNSPNSVHSAFHRFKNMRHDNIK